MLEPLTQFVCDTCSQIIQRSEEGWFEWIEDRDTTKSHSFRICHHTAYLPPGREAGCSRQSNQDIIGDIHLHHILKHPTAELLKFIDLGPYHEPEFRGPHVRDLREFLEMFRRLTIPHYEEARLYWDRARNDGFFEKANEITIYTQEFLIRLIEKYAVSK